MYPQSDLVARALAAGCSLATVASLAADYHADLEELTAPEATADDGEPVRTNTERPDM